MLIGDYPDQIVIDNYFFNFLCCSMNLTNNHFISFFKINNNFYKVDGLKTAVHRFEFIPPLQSYDNIPRNSFYSKKTNFSLYYIGN